MKKKKKSSIRIWLFVPLAVLAIMMFATSVISVTSLRNVNKEATTISDTYLAGITKLSTVQGYVKDIHTMGLSHIVATDAMNADIDTLITEAETAADEARDSLSAVYSGAFMMNVVAAVMGICIVIIAIMIIQRKVIAPVGRTEKELAATMSEVGRNAGLNVIVWLFFLL